MLQHLYDYGWVTFGELAKFGSKTKGIDVLPKKMLDLEFYKEIDEYIFTKASLK